jgi:UPF0755 protein
MKSKVLNIKVIIPAIFAIVLIAIGLSAYNAAFKKYAADEPKRFYIPSHASDNDIKDTLCSALGDDYGNAVFKFWSLRSGEPEKAYGSYVIEPGDRAWSVCNRLRTGRQTPVKVTFNNVRLLSELAERVSKNMEWNADKFMTCIDSVLPARGYNSSAEYIAAFVPDSYEFYWNDSPAKIINSLADERDKFWTDARRAKAKEMGLSPVEIATIASIAEEETGKADERGKVARLYLNRLKINMKLQADPTVKFAIGDFSLRRITGAHTKTQSPYNTYAVSGLPPGPIRLVERATLDAVLNAPKHDYLYMCASPKFNGYHDFARDYNTHMENAHAYQAELNRRNIH